MTTITIGTNTYNLVSLPAYPGFADYSFTHIDSVAVVSSPFVPFQQVQSWPGADMWGLEFTLPKMSRWVSYPWKGCLAELRGMANVIQVGDPLGATPLGTASGSPVCATSGLNNLACATSLVTSGWTPSVYGQLLPGDFLSIGYRLHEVCEQVNSDSSGNATIQIWPSLRESPANGTAITLTNCVGLFRLAQNSRSWHSDFTGLSSMSFKLTEVR